MKTSTSFLIGVLLFVTLSVLPTECYTLDRRRLWQQSAGVAAAALWGATAENSNAIISSKYCAYGTGDGCEDLAKGNEYIKQLQAKSASNKESIQREARNAFYMKNYPDWFASVGKNMVKKSDGTFMIVDDAELQKLKDANKIGLEIATTMGGRVTDLTQKPILVLKE